ncbi:nucleolar transcription factor 1 [Venturia canescens]|uniref:nucleolar transcription factor 1 n=1 Tax=Venturia canescens TaxID=32260 RepID=UPI001C9D25E3|nr:nucleolar transcription factor 1-like [Venturia canescens]
MVSYEEAKTLRDEISQLLNKGGLNLRQWASNDRRLLEGLPEGSVNLQLKTSTNTKVKTLGLYWDSEQDIIVYMIDPIAPTTKITKRSKKCRRSSTLWDFWDRMKDEDESEYVNDYVNENEDENNDEDENYEDENRNEYEDEYEDENENENEYDDKNDDEDENEQPK